MAFVGRFAWNRCVDFGGDLSECLLTTVTQRARPHFACGLVEAGASEVILPHVGWINTVPDARAIVDIEINGTALSFTGTGYRDKVCDSSMRLSRMSYSQHSELGRSPILQRLCSVMVLGPRFSWPVQHRLVRRH